MVFKGTDRTSTKHVRAEASHCLPPTDGQDIKGKLVIKANTTGQIIYEL